MFTLGTQAFEIILRTAVIYVFVLLFMRLAGKREIGQLTLFDLVVLLLVANAVQNAMVGPDTSLIGGLLAAITLVGLNYIVARLRLRWPFLRGLVEGSPTVLIQHGETIPKHLRNEGIDDQTLQAALREHGIIEIKNVELAVLETDGSISVVPIDGSIKRIRRPPRPLQH
jgi:uncharacterized membrane protein YcaP (DUF421 family)